MKGKRMRNAVAAVVGAVAILASMAGTAEADHSVTELVTPGTVTDVSFAGAAADGTPAFVVTQESLAAADQDSAADLYVPSGGSYKLLSDKQLAGPDGSQVVSFTGSSTDGVRVFFVTSEALTSDDGDFSIDVYTHSGSTTTLVSDRAQPGPDEAKDVQFVGASADGSRVFFSTNEALAAEDGDSNATSTSVPVVPPRCSRTG
jgi:hypothetical protein